MLKDNKGDDIEIKKFCETFMHDNTSVSMIKENETKFIHVRKLKWSSRMNISNLINLRYFIACKEEFHRMKLKIGVLFKRDSFQKFKGVRCFKVYIS